jgi:multidrug efflux pump subunit AcrA (membrane-fusion protein)
VFAFVAEKSGNGYAAQQKPITTGGIEGNDYVVQSGLQPGESLIATGVQNLIDGMPVKPE